VFAFKPFSLSDGAGASERLAGLAVIGIVARVWRAVALHEPSARGEHERNPGLVPVLFGVSLRPVPLAAARSSPGPPPGHALGGDPQHLAKAPRRRSMASYAVMSGRGERAR
jgi:hypothetical protein